MKQKCAAIAMLLLLNAGCRESVELPRKREPRGAAHHVVLISPESAGQPEHVILERAGEWLARRIVGAQIEIRPVGSRSPAQQQRLIEESRHRADILIVWPIEPEPLAPLLTDAVQRGVGVFLIGSDCGSGSRTAYSGPSEIDLGREAARACATALTGRAQSVLLLHAGDKAERDRSRYLGFTQELGQHGSIHLMHEENCGGDAIAAVREMRRVSRLYPRSGGWALLNDWPMAALGPKEPLAPVGMSVVLVATSHRYLADLKAGRIHALVTYDVQEAVRGALISAVQWLNQKEDVRQVDRYAPVETVTGLTLDQHDSRWQSWMKGDSTSE